jgi:hypothetical protein
MVFSKCLVPCRAALEDEVITGTRCETPFGDGDRAALEF